MLKVVTCAQLIDEIKRNRSVSMVLCCSFQQYTYKSALTLGFEKL